MWRGKLRRRTTHSAFGWGWDTGNIARPAQAAVEEGARGIGGNIYIVVLVSCQELQPTVLLADPEPDMTRGARCLRFKHGDAAEPRLQ